MGGPISQCVTRQMFWLRLPSEVTGNRIVSLYDGLYVGTGKIANRRYRLSGVECHSHTPVDPSTDFQNLPLQSSREA
jgi:hypothetical protein